jgi:Domain of unknown function (DUF4123)
MSSAAELIDWARHSRDNGRQPYLLMDSAQAENCHLRLERWQVPYASLFEGKPEESVLEIAPLLIPLHDLTDVLLDYGMPASCCKPTGQSSSHHEIGNFFETQMTRL